MLTNILLLISGLIILIAGSESLIRGSVRLAKKINMSEFLIGVLIISLGTSLPELSSSITAMLNQHSEIVIGSLIGSNITNILLIMSATVILSPITNIGKDQSFQKLANVLMVILMCLIGYLGLVINYIFGVIFLFILLFIMFYEIKFNSVHIEKELKTKKDNVLLIFAFIVVGLIALIYGANLFINSAVEIAKVFNVSETVIGISLVAIGTSLPELTVSLMSAIRKQVSFALGNILGSNLYNIFGILAVSSFFGTIEIPTRIANIDNFIMLFATLYLTLIALVLKKIPRWFGIFGVILYISYITSLYI